MMDDNQTELTGAEVLVDEAKPSDSLAPEVVKATDEATEKKDIPADTGDEKTDEAETGDDAGDKPKRKTGSARLRERLAAQDAELAELRQRVAPREETAPPQLSDFDNWEAFNAAERRFAAKEAIRELKAAEAQERIQSLETERVTSLREAHLQRVSEAKAVIPNYEKAIAAYTGEAFSDPLAYLTIQSDKSELLALHFASEPALVRELNRLDPIQLARRIGGLEARLSLPKSKTVSSAPPPVGALKGGSSPKTGPSLGMSDDAYARWRNGK